MSSPIKYEFRKYRRHPVITILLDEQTEAGYAMYSLGGWQHWLPEIVSEYTTRIESGPEDFLEELRGRGIDLVKAEEPILPSERTHDAECSP